MPHRNIQEEKSAIIVTEFSRLFLNVKRIQRNIMIEFIDPFVQNKVNFPLQTDIH